MHMETNLQKGVGVIVEVVFGMLSEIITPSISLKRCVGTVLPAGKIGESTNFGCLTLRKFGIQKDIRKAIRREQ